MKSLELFSELVNVQLGVYSSKYGFSIFPPFYTIDCKPAIRLSFSSSIPDEFFNVLTTLKFCYIVDFDIVSKCLFVIVTRS